MGENQTGDAPREVEALPGRYDKAKPRHNKARPRQGKVRPRQGEAKPTNARASHAKTRPGHRWAGRFLQSNMEEGLPQCCILNDLA